MPPSPPEENAEATRGTRASCILILLVLLGIPAIVVSGLLRSTPLEPVVAGSQPGGILHGRVIDASGAPVADAEVRFGVVPMERDGTPGRKASRIEARVRSASDGSFNISAPAFSGHYELSAGGDLWIRATRPVSLVDKAGKPTDPGVVDLVVEPGCLLRIEVADGSGAVSGSGKFSITGKPDSRGWLGIPRAPVDVQGRITDGLLEFGGLPPMNATVKVFMDDGRSGELILTLSTGIVREKIEL